MSLTATHFLAAGALSPDVENRLHDPSRPPGADEIDPLGADSTRASPPALA